MADKFAKWAPPPPIRHCWGEYKHSLDHRQFEFSHTRSNNDSFAVVYITHHTSLNLELYTPSEKRFRHGIYLWSWVVWGWEPSSRGPDRPSTRREAPPPDVSVWSTARTSFRCSIPLRRSVHIGLVRRACGRATPARATPARTPPARATPARAIPARAIPKDQSWINLPLL